MSIRHIIILRPEMVYNPAIRSSISRTHKMCANPASKVMVRSAPDILPVRTVFRYTLSELMLHEAFYVAYRESENTHPPVSIAHTTKLLGSIILSAHVPGQPEVAYEFPAQSPQNVISEND